MKTIAVQIQDNYIKHFINYVNTHSENISIVKDSNLELDPYFYERQKQLQQDIDDIDSGRVNMISNEDFWNDIDNFTLALQK